MNTSKKTTTSTTSTAAGTSPPQQHKQGNNLASLYALQVALQTMKERCQLISQRLATVEEENLELKKKISLEYPGQCAGAVEQNGRTEVDVLREKVGELTRKEYVLTEHMAMVAKENRQLWSRLSKLTKDNQTLGDSLSKIKDSLSNSTNQNLIRSKTFTQNSPNPILRQKMASSQIDSPENVSLEEISLKILNEFLEGKAEVEKQCNEIMASTPKPNSLGFGYLNDESLDADLQNDTRKCTEGMIDIKKELLRQQSDLKVALSSLRQRRVLEVCPSCKNHPKKPSTADKNLETDEILASRFEETFLPTTKSSRDELSASSTAPATNNVQIDFLEQKRMADTLDKMCPMCGKLYTNSSTFDEFQDHVEGHFIDDTDLDVSIDRNFEFISNSVGHF